MQARPSPLAGRYRFTKSLGSEPGAERWAALDADTGRHVVVGRVPRHRVERYESVKGQKHLHLAGVVDVVKDPDPGSLPAGSTLRTGDALAVAEFVPGRTLFGLLRHGPIHPFKAVAWLLRLVDAVQAIHARGGVHGAISPRVIVVEPVGRAIAPVLAQLICPAAGAYCSPERLEGHGPSPADDVWALYATLYAALTGTTPFAGGHESELKPLTDFGIDEPVLSGLLGSGLAVARRARTAELRYLMQALDAWERGRPTNAPPPPWREEISAPSVPDDVIVRDDADLPALETLEIPEDETARPEPGAMGETPLPLAEHHPVAARVAPPPLPAGRPAPRARATAAPAARWPRLAAVGIGAVVLAVAGFYYTLSRPKPAPALPEPAVSGPSSAVPVASGAQPLSPAERLAVCVGSYFPAGTFDQGVDLGFLCRDDDLRTQTTNLFALGGGRETADAGVGHPPQGPAGLVVRASKQEDLGWYELVAATIARTTCCKDPPLPVLPKTEGWCQQLQGEVRSVAEATRKSGDLAPYARRFEDAVVCLFATGTRRPYRYEKAPTDAQRRAFQVFLKNAAETDGVRARMPWLR